MPRQKKSLAERVEKFAQDVPENGETEPMVLMNFRIPKRLVRPLKIHVAQEETTIRELLTGLLEEELKRGKLPEGELEKAGLV